MVKFTGAKRFALDFVLNISYTPGYISVLGVGGRSGAGKTSFCYDLEARGKDQNIEIVLYDADWRLKLSTGERKQRLHHVMEQGKLEQFLNLADVEQGWDHDAISDDIQRLLQGNPIYLKNAWNQANGERDLHMPVNPPKKEGVVAVNYSWMGRILPKLYTLCYLHAPQEVPFEQNFARDRGRREFDDAITRLMLLTRAEDIHLFRYWNQFLNLGDRFIVIQNAFHREPVVMARPSYSKVSELLGKEQPFDNVPVSFKFLERLRWETG